MWVYLEPLIGWLIAAIGATMVAIGVMYGKRLATWSLEVFGKAVAESLGNQLEPRWTRSIRKEVDQALEPIHRELQIEQGAAKWPNGSSTLPTSISEIYRRQAETYAMVTNLVGQIESFIIGQQPNGDSGES